MTEIGFYHLTRTGSDRALPRLLARTLAAGARASVRCPSPERLAAIDTALWEVSGEWLPHGSASDGDAELQPIWLTLADEAPNGARYLFLVEGAETGRLDAFDRVFDLFDGRDEAAVSAARLRWKAAREAGHALTYWRQTGEGWEKGP